MQLRVMSHPQEPSIVSVALVLTGGMRVMGSHREAHIFEHRSPKRRLKDDWAKIVVDGLYMLPEPIPPFRTWKLEAEVSAQPYVKKIYARLRQRYPGIFRDDPSLMTDNQAEEAIIDFFNSRRKTAYT